MNLPNQNREFAQIKTLGLLHMLQTDEQSWACKQVCLTHQSTLFQCLCQHSNSANDTFSIHQYNYGKVAKEGMDIELWAAAAECV